MSEHVLSELFDEKVLRHNRYDGWAITERPCKICGGDFVLYWPASRQDSAVRICNFDLREMLPTMLEFVARKEAEDDSPNYLKDLFAKLVKQQDSEVRL